MSTTLQLIAVAFIVALAAGYVVRAAWKTWSGAKSGCGSGCGKCAAPEPPPEANDRRPLPMA